MVDGFAGCIGGQLVQRGREGQWQQPGNVMASERQARLGEHMTSGVLGYKHVTLGQHPICTDHVGQARKAMLRHLMPCVISMCSSVPAYDRRYAPTAVLHAGV